MSCERDFFTLKGEKFTFSNNLWSKNPFAKVEKIPFAKEPAQMTSANNSYYTKS
jgi:hypothetical protein